MKSNFFLQLIIFTFLLFSPIEAKADNLTAAEAENWAQDKGEKLLKAFSETNIKRRYELLDEMLLNYVDLEYISQFVVGKYWRQMSPEQKEIYKPLFKRYALSIYKSFPLNFNSDKIHYQILRARVEPNYANVGAKVTLDSADVPEGMQDILVDFRLNKKQGQICIVDLKLGESSLILSYRGRFYQMLAQNDGDIDWFLEDLETITSSTERQNLQKLEQSEDY